MNSMWLYKLNRLRVENNWSIFELADRLDVSPKLAKGYIAPEKDHQHVSIPGNIQAKIVMIEREQEKRRVEG